MKYYEEVQETENKRPCANIREDLKACLLATDCVRLHRKTPRECLLSKDPSVPDECLALRTTFFECKRSLMDNRQRFRGRKGYWWQNENFVFFVYMLINLWFLFYILKLTSCNTHVWSQIGVEHPKWLTLYFRFKVLLRYLFCSHPQPFLICS